MQRAINFTYDMRQAIRRGDKTQTRRLVKPQPTRTSKTTLDDCPYGSVPSKYWMNEPVKIQYVSQALDANGSTYEVEVLYLDDERVRKVLVSSEQVEILSSLDNKGIQDIPDFLARTWLVAESIKLEQLQDMSQQDYIAEGLQNSFSGIHVNGFDSSIIKEQTTPRKHIWKDYIGDSSGYNLTAKQSFISLWESCYGTDTYNPKTWVWVIRFYVKSPYERATVVSAINAETILVISDETHAPYQVSLDKLPIYRGESPESLRLITGAKVGLVFREGEIEDLYLT